MSPPSSRRCWHLPCVDGPPGRGAHAWTKGRGSPATLGACVKTSPSPDSRAPWGAFPAVGPGSRRGRALGPAPASALALSPRRVRLQPAALATKPSRRRCFAYSRHTALSWDLCRNRAAGPKPTRRCGPTAGSSSLCLGDSSSFSSRFPDACLTFHPKLSPTPRLPGNFTPTRLRRGDHLTSAATLHKVSGF